MKKFLSYIAIFCAALIAGNAFAHIGIARENVFALGDAPREYMEGTTAELAVQLPHDCSDEAGNHYPTIDTSILLPNGAGTLEEGYFSKNAVNGTKARVTATWEEVEIMKGPIDPYESHGNIIEEDTRSVHWKKGSVDNDHYDNLYIKTSFPKFSAESCATRLDVYVPSVQFCEEDYAIAWIGVEDSAEFVDGPKTRVTEDFAAKFTVVRNEEENPLPAGCDAEQAPIEAWPTTEEIDQYLPKMQ